MKTKVVVYIDDSAQEYPVKAKKGDVGYDIIATKDIILRPGAWVDIKIPMIIEVKSDSVFYMILPRSSYGKKGLKIANTVGLIDRAYCGPEDYLHLLLERRENYPKYDSDGKFVSHEQADPLVIKAGDAMCQLVFLEEAQIELTRGDIKDLKNKPSRSGFGSTNK